jgi:minimal PKS acyl carrier protein
MAEFTVHDLAELLRECSGDDELPDISGADADVSFEELGFDSLVLFNVMSKIERSYAVEFADDVVVEAPTPRELLEVIGSRI